MGQIKFKTLKGYGSTTIRTILNESGDPVGTYGTIDDMTLKAELFIDCSQTREQFGRWAVIWFKELGSGFAHVFDNEDDVLEYIAEVV